MVIEFDQVKRKIAFETRGVDFADATHVLTGPSMTYQDIRRDYGEERWITVGLLNNRMMVVTWTQRGQAYRIISMRKANDREQALYAGRLV